MGDDSMIDKIRKVKRQWIEASFVLVIAIPFVASLIVKDWSVYSDALSDFGTNPSTAGVWSVYLVVVAVGLWLHGTQKIEDSYSGIRSHILTYILSTASTSLILTAFVTGIYSSIHVIVAGSFFISYMIFVFMYGFWQLNDNLKEGAISTTTGLLLLLTGLLAIPFNGLAIFEIAYMSILIIWNYIIHRKQRVDKISYMFSRAETKQTPNI